MGQVTVSSPKIQQTSANSNVTQPRPHQPTGIAILVIGAGVGGIMSALECWRKGHTVRILERSSGPVETGDFFTVGPSAVKAFCNWPQLAKANEVLAYDPWVSYHKHTGEVIIPPAGMTWTASSTSTGKTPTPSRLYCHHRPKFYRMLLNQLATIGIQVEWKHRVIDYFEDAELGKGGVVLESGEKIEADVAIAADGLGTKSHRLVVGKKTEAKSSGYAIYRTAYPVEHALVDPEVAERFKILENGKSVNEIWVGPDMHLMVWRSEDLMSWTITRKDTGTVTEFWHDRTVIEDVLKYTFQIPGWPEIMNSVIRTTPKDGITDWKLMRRDPQPQWTSPEGRVVQLGDAAHTFVPSLGNGATQAIEDAICLATCLQLGGKSNIPLAVKVHNKLRFDRVSCCQKMGFVNQETYQHTNWDAVTKNPNAVKAKYGSWIWSHDAEEYTYANYEKAYQFIVEGTPFENTNIPPGYTPKPWSIDELLALKEEGKDIELEGDWS